MDSSNTCSFPHETDLTGKGTLTSTGKAHVSPGLAPSSTTVLFLWSAKYNKRLQHFHNETTLGDIIRKVMT